MRKRRLSGLTITFFLCILLALSVHAESRWTKLQNKYLNNTSVDRLIFVKYNGRYKTRLYMYNKNQDEAGNNFWEPYLKCKAFVGKNGINKTVQGDKKTPTGTFMITEGFGIYDNPGLKGLNYTKLNKYLYWSAERDTYNTMVDVRDLGCNSVAGEHLITYSPQYHYALVIGYNRRRRYKKGSGIFLHVFGADPYTGGCVAVSEENMVRIMQNTTDKTRICIYNKAS